MEHVWRNASSGAMKRQKMRKVRKNGMEKKMMGWVKKWIKEDRAATAVEFALVAVPFTYLLMGIIEMSLMFGGMSTLDAATNDAARLIRTGQVQQTNGDPEEMFRDKLCESAQIFLNCSNIQYEVIRMDGFSNFSSFPATYDEDGNLESQGFDPGAVDDVILIRTSYRYPLMTPFMAKLIADSSGNSKRLLSTVVLETEPYDVEQVADQL